MTKSMICSGEFVRAFKNPFNELTRAWQLGVYLKQTSRPTLTFSVQVRNVIHSKLMLGLRCAQKIEVKW